MINLKSLTAILLFLCVMLQGVVFAEESKADVNQSKLAKTKILLDERQAGAEKSNKANKLSWRPDEDSKNSTTSPLAMFKGLALCLGAFMIMVFFIKRLGRPNYANSQRHMNVRERLAISNKTSLLLVEVNGSDLVVAVGSETVNFHAIPPKKLMTKVKNSNSKESVDAECAENIKLSA